MRNFIISAIAIISISLFSNSQLFDQIKYQDGLITIGNTATITDYTISVKGNGIYFDHTNGRFLQNGV